MPAGKVLNPDGPQAQEKLGQILCTDGAIISFFNTKNLSEGEPVIFDIIRTNLSVKVEINGEKYNYNGMVPVGILPKEFEIDRGKEGKKWSEGLQKRWRKEWSKFKDDEEIKNILGSNLKTPVINHPHCN